MTKKRAMSSCKQSRAMRVSSRIKRWAIIEGSFEATHCWPQAPITEAYLRSPHRHLFEVKVQIEVFHEDREIEYYNFKSQLSRLLVWMPNPINYSCEKYSDIIATNIKNAYPKRDLKVTILEDGHEGALCEYSK